MVLMDEIIKPKINYAIIMGPGSGKTVMKEAIGTTILFDLDHVFNYLKSIYYEEYLSESRQPDYISQVWDIGMKLADNDIIHYIMRFMKWAIVEKCQFNGCVFFVHTEEIAELLKLEIIGAMAYNEEIVRQIYIQRCEERGGAQKDKIRLEKNLQNVDLLYRKFKEQKTAMIWLTTTASKFSILVDILGKIKNKSLREIEKYQGENEKVPGISSSLDKIWRIMVVVVCITMTIIKIQSVTMVIGSMVILFYVLSEIVVIRSNTYRSELEKFWDRIFKRILRAYRLMVDKHDNEFDGNLFIA